MLADKIRATVLMDFFKELSLKTNVLLLILLLSSVFYSKTYYVATTGNDDFPGTIQQPFRTLQKAASILGAGDICYVREGTYRETVELNHSGTAGAPITFKAFENEKVILDGTDVLQLEWSIYKNRIYKATTNKRFNQIFLDRTMLVEARWPNMTFPEDLWKESCWSAIEEDNVLEQQSRYGIIVDEELAETGIDWTGAIAVLNIYHQFYTWSRPVRNNSAGSNTFYYETDLRGIPPDGEENTKPWKWDDDRYYLVGKLEALDYPGEWFLDETTNTLYVWTPNGDSPANYFVRAKHRGFVFVASNKSYITIDGFNFFATAFTFSQCNYIIIRNCNLCYSSYSHHLRIEDISDPHKGEDSIYPIIEKGIGNEVSHCYFAYGALTGLYMGAQNCRVEDNILHDFSWHGSLSDVCLRVGRSWRDCSNNTIQRNTVYNAGGPVLHFNGPNSIIEYNHIYDGLRARFGGSRDGSLLYTQGPSADGCEARYNWVHGAYCSTVLPSEISNWGGGIGIRGDDVTLHLSVHHNVVWDCGGAGIVVKGDSNRVYNNTIFNIGGKWAQVGNFIDMRITKPYENEKSIVFNNVAKTVRKQYKEDADFPYTEHMSHNFQDYDDVSDLKLENPENDQFQPKGNSPLVNTGIDSFYVNDMEIPGVVITSFVGEAPDIGAYEFGGEYWVPGATWEPDDWLISSVLKTCSSLPQKFVLFQNYPNPFNATTQITFQINQPAHVVLSIYNTLGQRINILLNEFLIPGKYIKTLDASSLGSGIYFYQLKMNDQVDEQKCLVLK